MPAPAFSFYEDDSTVLGGTEINSGNPIDFGQVDKGTISPIITIHIWNGKNDITLDTAVAPKLYATNGVGDASLIFNGTVFNNNESMLEARSCGSFGVAADQHEDWVPIKPSQLLTMGDMPTNSMRSIELRLNVPIDAPTLVLTPFSLRVSA
jgi:hypothetical protein